MSLIPSASNVDAFHAGNITNNTLLCPLPCSPNIGWNDVCSYISIYFIFNTFLNGLKQLSINL